MPFTFQASTKPGNQYSLPSGGGAAAANLSNTMLSIRKQNLETAQDVVINMQAQLQNQGVLVEPVFLPVAEWKQKVWKDGDFDLILSQWSFDRNEDVYEQFHSRGSRSSIVRVDGPTRTAGFAKNAREHRVRSKKSVIILTGFASSTPV